MGHHEAFKYYIGIPHPVVWTPFLCCTFPARCLLHTTNYNIRVKIEEKQEFIYLFGRGYLPEPFR